MRDDRVTILIRSERLRMRCDDHRSNKSHLIRKILLFSYFCWKKSPKRRKKHFAVLS